LAYWDGLIWGTDAEGNNLPYLDDVIGKLKREDSVRMTVLLTGQVQLADALATADVERFTQRYSRTYNIWHSHIGGRLLIFNFRRGPFQDKRLCLAAAHALDRQAIHHSVYYGQGVMNNQPYPEGNRWHMDGIRMLEYDPERAKALLKEAWAVGTERLGALQYHGGGFRTADIKT
jgi:ABC-type transport system substrate-binding protein